MTVRRLHLQRLLIFAVAGATTLTFFINLCAFIFQCGCQSLWNGGAEHCNIHTRGVRHCPWCSYGTGGYVAAVIAIVVAQLVISFLPARLHWLVRLSCALAAFPLSGALVAAIYGLYSGYWASS